MNSFPRNTQRSPSSRLRPRSPALRLVPSTCSQEATTERWPSAGEAGIGSLDAAAAVGRDPFKSPVRLWMEKTERHDLLQPVDPCLVQSAESAAYWGRLLEPIVAAHYALRTGRQVKRTRDVLRHPQHPWMMAEPGREVVGAPDVQLLECRCVGMDAAEHWGAGLPDCVRIQMLHRLAVTGAQALDVVALICGQDLQIHRVERDEIEIARLIDAEREFWHCVQADCAPLAGDSQEV